MGWCVEVENDFSSLGAGANWIGEGGGSLQTCLGRSPLLPHRVGNEGSGLRAVWVQEQLELSLKLGRKGERSGLDSEFENS